MSTTTLSELRVMLEDALDEVYANKPSLAIRTISKALRSIDAKTLSGVRVRMGNAIEELNSGALHLSSTTISKALGTIEAKEFVESLKAVAEYRGKQ